MSEGGNQAIDLRLKHELGNALMVVLTFAQLIDHEAPGNVRIHEAVNHIKDAVERSRIAVNDVSRELGEIAGRLSSSSTR